MDSDSRQSCLKDLRRPAGLIGFAAVKPVDVQPTSWSSLLSTAIRAAVAIVKGPRRRRRDIALLKPAEIEKTAEFTQIFYRVRDKIEHHAEGQLHAAQVVAEELRFFFGAEAVVVFRNGQCIHRSLTQKEFEKLTQKLGTASQGGGAPTCRLQPVSFTEDEIKEVGANDNLRDCRELVIASGLGKSLQWAIWLWCGADGPATGRLKVFQSANPAAAKEFWRCLGALLDLAPASSAEVAADISALSPPEGISDVEVFLRAYEEYFLPLDSILEPLRRRISGELQDYLQVEANEISCVFSVRHREQDAVHFYVTARQAREFVTSPNDIQLLREFSNFLYGKGEALSGWVMETGACLYLQDFTTSNLWRRYVEGDARSKPERAAQLERVEKFFRVKNGNLKHAYLVPVLLQQKQNTQGISQLRTDLMLSITVAKPLDIDMRRHIFELVQRLGDAVDVALKSQKLYESAIEQMTVSGLLQPLARFVTHDLRGSAQRLQIALNNPNTTLDILRTECGSIVEEVGSICSVVEAYHEYLSAGRVLRREAVDNFGVFLEKTWADAWEALISREGESATAIKKMSQVFSPPRLPATFRIHRASFAFVIRHLLKNSVHAMKDKPDGSVRLTIKYDAANELVRLEFWDNGPGMTAGTRQMLLAERRVSRVPGTDQDKEDGYSGFGMYFIRLFCRAHDATIKIPFTNEARANECLIVVEFRLSKTTP